MDSVKYQVFISSTYSDLIDERRQVLEVLLMADCIPAGMELFPAMDEEQFEACFEEDVTSEKLDEIRKPSSPDKGGLDNQANTPALDGCNKLLRKIEKARDLQKNNPENPVRNDGSEKSFFS